MITRRSDRMMAVSPMAWQELESSETWSFKGDRDGYRFIVAANRPNREKAYRLAYDVYRQSGFVPKTSREMVISPYDKAEKTFTLLVEDRLGRPCATASLILDSDERGLPSDEIYESELLPLRLKKLQLVEVTRLAIKPGNRNQQKLFLHMTNLMSIYSRYTWHATDWVAQVNPKHVDFYLQCQFIKIGGLKQCPRVLNAPAILLRQDLRVHANLRKVFPFYSSVAEEPKIASFLMDQHAAMSRDEVNYFGLDREVEKERMLV